MPKDELVKAVWPGVVVTDESLTRCVSDVRLALNDAGQGIIKTVPRRGYLLTVPVSKLEPPVMAPSQERGPDAAPRRPAKRRQLSIMAIVATSIMIVAGAFWWWPRSPDTSPSATVLSATADKQHPLLLS